MLRHLNSFILGAAALQSKKKKSDLGSIITWQPLSYDRTEQCMAEGWGVRTSPELTQQPCRNKNPYCANSIRGKQEKRRGE